MFSFFFNPSKNIPLQNLPLSNKDLVTKRSLAFDEASDPQFHPPLTKKRKFVGFEPKICSISNMKEIFHKWRNQKSINDKENRRREIKALEEELAERTRSRHNRKIVEYEMKCLLLQVEGLRLERPKIPREEFPGFRDILFYKVRFLELPYHAKKVIQIIWNRSAPHNEIFSNDSGVDITRKDLLTLFGTEWLNDEVINFYINLIVNRSRSDKKLPKVYAFNTFFYQNLCQKGFPGVKRWTRKVDIFDHEILLVPIHLGNHWCMTVIDLEQRKIDYYDSLLGDNLQCLELLKQYLVDESMDKRKRPFDMDGWEYTCRKDIPHQQNLWDCGMFSCLFAEYASRRAPIKFTQQHIPYFRERIVYEIIKKELL